MTESILEHPDPITTGEPGPADAEVVLPRFHTRLKRSFWLPSLAGKGWPERMRSTAFLFFGLTAAAGLALVAIFAQLNFPLLSPVPVGGGPSRSGEVSRAVALDREGALALAPARRSPSAPAARGNGPAAGGSPSGEGGGDVVTAVGGPTPVPAPEETGGDVGGVPPAAPPATPAPAPEPAPSGTSESAGTAPTPAPSPAPNPTPSPAPNPTPSPDSSSKDDKKPAKAKPAKPAKAKPPKDHAKADQQEEKADPKPTDEESMAPGPKYEPAPEPAPKSPTPSPEDSAGKDHGKGKALGHDK